MRLNLVIHAARAASLTAAWLTILAGAGACDTSGHGTGAAGGSSTASTGQGGAPGSSTATTGTGAPGGSSAGVGAAGGGPTSASDGGDGGSDAPTCASLITPDLSGWSSAYASQNPYANAFYNCACFTNCALDCNDPTMPSFCAGRAPGVSLCRNCLYLLPTSSAGCSDLLFACYDH
jgi:hypothetical protein